MRKDEINRIGAMLSCQSDRGYQVREDQAVHNVDTDPDSDTDPEKNPNQRMQSAMILRASDL